MECVWFPESLVRGFQNVLQKQCQKLVMSNHKRKLSTYNFTVFDMATIRSCTICGEKQEQNVMQTSWKAAYLIL